MNGYISSNRSAGNTLLAFLGGMVVWAVFGDRIKAKVNENKTYQELKDRVMNKVDTLSEMTEDKYYQIVDEVSSGYSKAKGISQNELLDLISDLRMHWAKIKDRWNQPPPQKLAGTPPSADIQNFNEGSNY
jgi:hypothetical protein